jgi:hypothetical protein
MNGRRRREQDSAIAEAADHWQAKLEEQNRIIKMRLRILTRREGR